MKSIILQHFTGDPGRLQDLSVANIWEYATVIGSDYQFLRGNVFHPDLSPPCQKMIMLDSRFDDYEWVVMLDTDMFAVNGLEASVFTDIEGTGLFVPFTSGVFTKCLKAHPTLCDPDFAYWGGCLWRLHVDKRKELRKHLRFEDMRAFSGNFDDEGIMHRLAVLTKTKQDSIPESWSFSSYLPGAEQASMIHIRKKASVSGPRTEKLDNYLALRKRGIIR